LGIRQAVLEAAQQLGVEFVVGGGDFETEVVHPHPPAVGNRSRIVAHLDEEQLVVGATRAVDRGAAAQAGHRVDFVEAEHVAIEAARPLKIAYVKDDVAELLDLHWEHDIGTVLHCV